MLIFYLEKITIIISLFFLTTKFVKPFFFGYVYSDSFNPSLFTSSPTEISVSMPAYIPGTSKMSCIENIKEIL